MYLPNGTSNVWHFVTNLCICKTGCKTDRYPVLRHLEDQWKVQMDSLGTLDPYQGCKKKDDARADAWKTWPLSWD